MVRRRQVGEESPAEAPVFFGGWSAGQRVRIVSGPLASSEAILLRTLSDGRWMMRLLDAGPGIYVCLGSGFFAEA